MYERLCLVWYKIICRTKVNYNELTRTMPSCHSICEDDVIFELCRRGFFGRNLRVSTHNLPCIETSREGHALRKWTKRGVRFVYFMNMCVAIGGLSYLTNHQRNGAYRCQDFTVSFGDDIWEDAWIINENGEPEQRLLVFAHFNGIYRENGMHDHRPKYTEMNKEDGDPFQTTVPAEIIYCSEIESWVFQHRNIRTSLNEEQENDCSWLLKSPNTESYDLIELAEETEWYMWTGLTESDYPISIECNECDDTSSCNYHGQCIDGE